VETKVLFKVTCVQELSSHFFSFILLPFLLALIFCYAVCYCEFGTMNHLVRFLVFIRPVILFDHSASMSRKMPKCFNTPSELRRKNICAAVCFIIPN